MTCRGSQARYRGLNEHRCALSAARLKVCNRRLGAAAKMARHADGQRVVVLWLVNQIVFCDEDADLLSRRTQLSLWEVAVDVVDVG